MEKQMYNFKVIFKANVCISLFRIYRPQFLSFINDILNIRHSHDWILRKKKLFFMSAFLVFLIEACKCCLHLYMIAVFRTDKGSA